MPAPTHSHLHTEALRRQVAVSIYRLSNHHISLSSGGLTFLKISFTFQVIAISHRLPQFLILSFIPISYNCQHVASQLHKDISSHPSQPHPSYSSYLRRIYLWVLPLSVFDKYLESQMVLLLYLMCFLTSAKLGTSNILTWLMLALHP